MISQYIETNSGSTPKGIEIFNISGSDITFSAGNNLVVHQGTNGGPCNALSSTNTTSGTLAAGEVWVIGSADLTSYATSNGTDISGTTTFGFSFNGDDALQVYLGGVLQDVFGTCGTDPGSSWSGGGVSTANQNLEILPGICNGTTSNWSNPSLRFANIANGSTMTGFGNAPSGCSGCPAPTTQASAFTFNTVTGNSMNVDWTNGNGAGRVVIMNSSNSFTAPADGSNPGASTAWANAGQQVVYNGTGSGPISITGLASSTTYWFRVYEYCSPDRNYNTTTATDNPLSQATTASSITSATNGDWFTGSTWVGGVVPGAGDNVTILHNVTSGGAITRNGGTFTTVAPGSSLAVAAVFTNNGSTTINGSFQLNPGGWATGNNFTYGADGTLIFNNTTAYGVNNGDVFWPAANSPFNVSVLQGGLTMNSTSRTVPGLFLTAAGVTLNGGSVLTLSGTCQVNNGGFFNQSPTYSGATSTLIYNIGAAYGTFNEWTGGGNTNPTVGVGVPGNVTLSLAGTNVTLAGARGIPGNLTVNGSTTFTLNGGAGDFFIGGNFTQNGTLINNNRAVQFVQSAATQIITASAGNIFFDYFLINKPAGSVLLSATDVTMNTTAGDIVQFLNTGSLNLDGNNLNLNNAGGNILSNGGARNINSTSPGAQININGNKNFTFSGASPSLNIAANIIVRLNGAGSNFGTNTTISGILQLNAGGFVQVGGAPFYAVGATLNYNAGGNYGRGNEWISNVSGFRGYPHHILISNNTSVSPGANGGSNTSWEAGGNLTVDAGSGFFLDFGGQDMNLPIRILGDVNISGGLSLSDNINGDLKVRGDFTLNGGSAFNANNRAVFFTRNGTQTITSPTTVVFHYMVFEPVSGGTIVQLESSTDLSVTAPSGGNAISFSSASDRLVINGRTITIGTAGVDNAIAGAGTFTGSNASNITLRGTGSVGTLNFTAGSQILGTLTMNRQPGAVGATLGTPLSINNSLFLTNGILALGSNNLTFTAGGSTSGASVNSFVAADADEGTGELRKTFTSNGAFTFPVGDISAPNGNQYSPATINFNSGSYSSAYAGIQVRDIIHPDNPTTSPAISRYWILTSSGITSPNYSFTGTYTAADIIGTEASSFAGRWNGTSWTQGASLAANTMSLSGLTTLSAANEFSGGVFICAAPGNATAVSATNPSAFTLDVNWTNGTGAGRVILFNSSNTFAAPANGANPSANLVYGGGQQVVFNGTGSGPISVTGLDPLTTYYVRVYEYCNPGRNYASGTIAVNGTTLALPEPTDYPSVFACGITTTTTIPLSWTDASTGQVPDGYLIKWSSGGYGSIAAPSDFVAEANGAGVQNVAQGSGAFTVTGLIANTTYYFKIWSYTNSGTDINYKLGSEPQTTCATIPAPWEDFETGTKGSYTIATVTCTAGDWILDDVILGTLANDRKNGAKSARVRNTGRVEMDFDISVGGIEQFTVLHAAFGADGNSDWILEASTNGGSSWTQYGGTITTSSTTLTAQSFTLSLPAPVRIRLVKTSGGTNRINFDDMSYTVYAGCTAPAGQVAGLNSSNPTSNGIDLSWTTGGGSDGTLVTVRPTSAGLVAPISGNAYAANTNYGVAPQLNTDNRALFRNSGSSVSGLTGLDPETQYTATGYSYANVGSCYNLSGPSSHTFWTLSSEPGGHSATFTATAVAYDQIDLAFNAANLLANADGYIILRRTGAAPTGLPADATSYTVGASIGDATVAAIVTSSAATSTSITGLSATTQYYFTLVPFNWNTSQPLTYNYRTAATIPSANATTLVEPATLSDIISDGSYVYSNDIDYTLYQSATITNTGSGAGGSIGVWRFTIRDGGGVNDLDGLPTILESITFSSVVGIDGIRTAALFDGNALVSNAATVNAGAGTIAFSGLSYSCAHNSTRNLTLRVTFSLSPIVDNQQMQFTILNADVAAAAFSTSSLFTNFTAVSSSVAGNNNSLEVTGTELAFFTQPISFVQSSNMPAVTVGSVDANGNQDLDFIGTVDIISSGTLASSPQIATATGPSGLATFTSINHTAVGSPLNLTATSPGQTMGVSNPFTISNIAPGSYRTTSAGSWGTTNTATWEQFSGSWAVSGPPATNTSDVVYIRHTINTVGSFGSSVIMIVENGGFITNASSSTCASLTIQNGGTFQVNANLSIASGGDLNVEDGGNLIINFAYGNPGTSLWNGTEDFEPESNLIFYHWDHNDFLFNFTSSPVNTNTYNGFSAFFGNVIFDLASGANSMSTWTIAEAVGVTSNLIHNDMIFRSVDPGQTLRLSTFGALIATIGGDLIIESGFSGIFQLKTGGSLELTVNGDVNLNDGIFRVMAGSQSGSYSYLNILGDLNILGNASFDFNSTVTSNIVETRVNIDGDLTVEPNALMESSNGNGANRGFLNFTGTGDGLTPATTQTINCASTQAGRYDNLVYNVNNGAYARIINQNLELSNQGNVIVSSGGVFDFGFNGGTALRVQEISGGANNTAFNLNPGGRIKITHPNGIDAGTANEGNVVTDIRSFSATGIYHYIGLAPNQRIGDGLPSASFGKHVIVELDALTTNLLFEGYNGSLYTSTGNIGLSNAGDGLLIIQGTVVGTNSADFFGSGKIEMIGGLYRIQTNSGVVPLLSDYSNYSLSGGTIELNASGNQELSGAVPFYHNIAVTGANTYLTDAKTVSSSFVVNNNVSISGTSVFDIQNRGMTGNAGLTMTGGRLRMSKLNTSLPELDAISTPYSLTGGVIEYYGTNASQQQLIRGGITYFDIDINASLANYSAPSTAGNVNAASSFVIDGEFTVNSPAVFRLDAADNISGIGDFTLMSGSGFLYGSPNGVKLSGTSTSDGNIRISGTRTFPVDASYGFVGASDMVPGDALPASLENLYLLKTNPASTVTINDDIVVNNTLTLTAGLIDLDGNNLIVGNITSNGEVANGSANSYLITWKSNAPNGLLRRYSNTFTSYFFPIGDENFYSPVTVNLNSASDMVNPYLEAFVNAEPHPNIGTATSYLNRFWTVEPTGITDPNYSVNLSYDAADIVGIESSLYPFKWNAGGWVGAGGSPSAAIMGTGSVNTGTKTLSWDGLFTFSEFTGIGDGSPLPIELITFSADLVKDEVVLNWITASEINNDYFVIEKTRNLTDILELDKVNGSGNSNYTLYYQQIDSKPYDGVSYYRLVQYDFNGNHSKSDWVALNYNAEEAFDLKFFKANKLNSTIEFATRTLEGEYGIDVTDMFGRTVAYPNNIGNSNSEVHVISISDLARGVYIFRISSKEGIITRKFMW